MSEIQKQGRNNKPKKKEFSEEVARIFVSTPRGGEEPCSNLKTIASDSRMSMSLLRKFGKSNPPLDPAHFCFDFVQELSIILRKPNLRLRQGH